MALAPGPWEVRRGATGEYDDVYAVDHPDCLATTAILGWTAEERQAHARAIATIPDLLEAAVNVLVDLGEPAVWKDVCPEHHQQLFDAVAKMKGDDGP